MFKVVWGRWVQEGQSFLGAWCYQACWVVDFAVFETLHPPNANLKLEFHKVASSHPHFSTYIHLRHTTTSYIHTINSNYFPSLDQNKHKKHTKQNIQRILQLSCNTRNINGLIQATAPTNNILGAQTLGTTVRCLERQHMK